MHISDGILTETTAGTVVLVTTSVLAAAATAWGVRRMDFEHVARAAVLTAAFFVASLVHLRIGISSVHLILNGLVGLILGWAAFPAFLIGLLLQSVFFGHGGITTIGLTVFNFGVAALIFHALLSKPIRTSKRPNMLFWFGFIAGAGALLTAAGLIVVELLITGEEFEYLAGAFFLAHLPVALIEGAIAGAAVAFIHRVKPELLAAPMGEKD